jgi:Protein of unknown function (DUF4235)
MSAEGSASGAVRMLYRPVGTLSGVVAHVLADALSRWVWMRTPCGRHDRTPGALQSKYRLRDVLVAATLRGAIAGGVKALMVRGGATIFQHWTGEWPGD